MTNPPRIVLASPSSGEGKTTVAVGLMAALRKRGLKVQPFKVGPDYIDPTYHKAAAGTPSRNLDVWLTSPKAIRETFLSACGEADVAVIEGVMGLFDGKNAADDWGSTAHVASLLKAPVVLVVDAHGMARSAAAVVLGFKRFSRRAQVRGVILNHVGSQKHLQLVAEAVEREADVPVLGGLPKTSDVALPERHLGLVPAAERGELNGLLPRLAGLVEAHVDLDETMRIARAAEALKGEPSRGGRAPARAEGEIKVGVAMDEAFSFYYHDSLRVLESQGASLEFFSPLRDERPPAGVCGLYFGGGFPEVFARRLSENRGMLRAVKKMAEDGAPVYAECGGLMYLTRGIRDFEGAFWPTVGLFPAVTVMGSRLRALGYTEAKVVRDNPLSRVGWRIRGHEFHYSRLEGIPADARLAYELERGRGIVEGRDGWTEQSTLASYMHTHFLQNPKLARNFLSECVKYRRR